MTLSQVSSTTRFVGTERDLVIPGGTSLKIETSPDGTEVLDVEVPEGETWTALIIVDVQVEET